MDTPVKSQFIDNGKLNIVRVLQKFQELMKAEYRQEDEVFLEKYNKDSEGIVHFALYEENIEEFVSNGVSNSGENA